MNKKIRLLPIRRFFLDHCGHSKNTLAQRGQSDEKQTVIEIFFRLFKICEKGEEGQNWENAKACTF